MTGEKRVGKERENRKIVCTGLCVSSCSHIHEINKNRTKGGNAHRDCEKKMMIGKGKVHEKERERREISYTGSCVYVFVSFIIANTSKQK